MPGTRVGSAHRWWRAIRLGTVGAAALAVTSCSPAHPSPGSSGAGAHKLAAIGTYPVGTRTVTLVDRSRPTPANGPFPGSTVRTLVTTFVYPARRGTSGRDAPVDRSQGALPVVVFGHGFDSVPADYSRILTQWASAGLVVAAPSFPLSNHAAPGGPTIADVAHQPGDMSFVISQVEAMDRDRSGWLGGGVDLSRIGAAGHSLGAITTLGLVYDSCCTDPRVKAAVTLAGAPILLPGTFFSVAGPPLMVVQGDHDPTVNYRYGVETYQQARPPKYMVTVLGAGHSGPYQGRGPDQVAVARSTVDFFDAYLDRDSGGRTRLGADANVAGVVRLEASAA